MKNQKEMSTLMIVAVIIIIVVLGAGVLWYLRDNDESTNLKYKITVSVIDMINGESINNLTLQATGKDGDDSIIELAKTDNGGIAVFVLPQGHYIIEPASKRTVWTGGIDVLLDKQKSVELKLLEALK